MTYYNFHYNISKHDCNWNHVTKDFCNFDDCYLFREKMIAAGFICVKVKKS